MIFNAADLGNRITGNYGEDQFNRRPYGTTVDVVVHEDGRVVATARDEFGFELDQYETRMFDGESERDASGRAQDEVYALLGWDGD